MGSCTHFDTTLNAAIACELGPENKIVVRGAGGGDYSKGYGGWEGCVWMVVEHCTAGRWITQVLWRRDGRDTTIKWVSEEMGPGSFDVPENVWAQRPELDPAQEWAAEWRAGVEKFRAAYPHYVRNLTDADIGREILIDGHNHDGPWIYRGEHRRRRTTVKVFDAPGPHRYRLPRIEERLRRFRYATQEVA